MCVLCVSHRHKTLCRYRRVMHACISHKYIPQHISTIHTHPCIYLHTHTHTHTLTHSLTHSLAHTHTHRHTLTNFHTYTLWRSKFSGPARRRSRRLVPFWCRPKRRRCRAFGTPAGRPSAARSRREPQATYGARAPACGRPPGPSHPGAQGSPKARERTQQREAGACRNEPLQRRLLLDNVEWRHNSVWVMRVRASSSCVPCEHTQFTQFTWNARCKEEEEEVYSYSMIL